jgi:hypothetical protein
VIGAAPATPAVSVTAMPERVTVTPTRAASVTVLNTGRTRVVVDASSVGYALDARGRPRLGAPVRLFVVSPLRLALRAGERAALRVVAAAGFGGLARGDHTGALLLATRPQGGAIPVAVRIGVVVTLRVPGRLLRRLVLGRARVSRGKLVVPVRNVGDVDEWVGGRDVSLVVARAGRRPVRVFARPRHVLAHTRGLLELPWTVPRAAMLRVRTIVSPRLRPVVVPRRPYRLRL